MTETMPNLWPTDLGEPAVLTPIAILRQQGQALGQRTQNIVVGRVDTYSEGEGFDHAFRLYCSPLGYAVQLLSVKHGIDLYPATIHLRGEAAPLQAKEPAEFTDKLKQVFASEKTKKIIASLLAQSKQ